MDESETATEPLSVLPSSVDLPEMVALPFTIDPPRTRVGPEARAYPHTAESAETKTDGLTEAVIATLPPPLLCIIVF
jgi:hypothetical protein